eukprot:1635708-Prymnesium_polylepis.1
MKRQPLVWRGARVRGERGEEEEEGVGLSVRTEFFFFFFLKRRSLPRASIRSRCYRPRKAQGFAQVPSSASP